jgi:L-2-hydroxyglutarate oxidase LhgO
MKYWITHLKNGCGIIDSKFNFNPSMFYGTEDEYRAKLTEVYGRFLENEYGKVTGSKSYTKEEYEQLKPRY